MLRPHLRHHSRQLALQLASGLWICHRTERRLVLIHHNIPVRPTIPARSEARVLVSAFTAAMAHCGAPGFATVNSLVYIGWDRVDKPFRSIY